MPGKTPPDTRIYFHCILLALQSLYRDRVGNDDVIGTAVIPINAVSAAGDDGEDLLVSLENANFDIKFF